MNKNIFFVAVGGIGLYLFLQKKRNGSFSKESIVLYNLDYCPYCKKVRDKLKELGLDYTIKNVELAKYKKELAKKRDGKTTVPYLEICGQGFEESDVIVKVLDEKFGSMK